MRMSRSLTIEATPEIVFSYLTVTEKRAMWLTNVVSEERLSEGPKRAGDVTLMRIREGNTIGEYKVITRVYNPPIHLEIDMAGPNLGDMVMHVEYRLTDLGGRSCQLDYLAQMDVGNLLFRLLSPIFTLMGTIQLNGMFRQLRKAAESEAAGIDQFGSF